MGSKGLVFFGLLVALVLLISSEVSAKDLAEKQGHNGVNDYQGGGRGGRGGDYPGGGGRGGGRNDPPRGRGCYHGCCRRSNYGPPQCLRCCSYAGEAIDTQTQTKPHN